MIVKKYEYLHFHYDTLSYDDRNYNLSLQFWQNNDEKSTRNMKITTYISWKYFIMTDLISFGVWNVVCFLLKSHRVSFRYFLLWLSSLSWVIMWNENETNSYIYNEEVSILEIFYYLCIALLIINLIVIWSCLIEL